MVDLVACARATKSKLEQEMQQTVMLTHLVMELQMYQTADILLVVCIIGGPIRKNYLFSVNKICFETLGNVKYSSTYFCSQ